MLHVIPSLSLAAGGPPIVAVNIARGLMASGVGTSLFTTSAFHGNPKSTEVESPPPGLNELDAKVFPLGMLRRLAYSHELGDCLKKKALEYDVMHIHMLFQYPQFAAFKVAHQYGIPYVVSPHGALDPYLRKRGKLRKWAVDRIWQRQMMDEACAIHYTTEEERQLVADLGFSAPAAIIPNGVDVDAFRIRPSEPEIDAIKTALNLGAGPLIVNHGRLDRKKGLPILIQAMKRIVIAMPDAKLVLVGPDSRGHQRELEQIVESQGLQGAVEFAGLRRGTELMSLIHAADVWALPSYTENFGYAVAEAMAAGKAVVTSPYVNIAPAAEQDQALVVVENEPDLVGEAILRLLSNEHERRELGERASAYAEQFDWSAVGDQFIDLYRSIVENH